MASIQAVPNAVYNMDERADQATTVISSYVAKHTAMDVAIGILGTFIPFGGLASMGVSIAAQAPVIYQPMVKDLAKIYSKSPDKTTTGIVAGAIVVGGIGDAVSEAISEYLSSEFGQEFLLEILGEIAPELTVGLAAGALPLVGGVVGAALDAILAATLTWQVGTMTSMYFFNGEVWIGGSKLETRKLVKNIVGFALPPVLPKSIEYVVNNIILKNKKVTTKVDIAHVSKQNPEIRDKTVEALRQQIEIARELDPSTSKDKLRALWRTKKIPDYFIEEALKAA